MRQGSPIKQLCDLFVRETRDGKDMAVYNELLGKTVTSVSNTFKKRLAAGLQGGHDFVIPDQQAQVSDHDDFELITWLVIK
jgi:hypothetical protein